MDSCFQKDNSPFDDKTKRPSSWNICLFFHRKKEGNKKKKNKISVCLNNEFVFPREWLLSLATEKVQKKYSFVKTTLHFERRDDGGFGLRGVSKMTTSNIRVYLRDRTRTSIERPDLSIIHETPLRFNLRPRTYSVVLVVRYRWRTWDRLSFWYLAFVLLVASTGPKLIPCSSNVLARRSNETDSINSL